MEILIRREVINMFRNNETRLFEQKVFLASPTIVLKLSLLQKYMILTG